MAGFVGAHIHLIFAVIMAITALSLLIAVIRLLWEIERRLYRFTAIIGVLMLWFWGVIGLACRIRSNVEENIELIQKPTTVCKFGQYVVTIKGHFSEKDRREMATAFAAVECPEMVQDIYWIVFRENWEARHFYDSRVLAHAERLTNIICIRKSNYGGHSVFWHEAAHIRENVLGSNFEQEYLALGNCIYGCDDLYISDEKLAYFCQNVYEFLYNHDNSLGFYFGIYGYWQYINNGSWKFIILSRFGAPDFVCLKKLQMLKQNRFISERQYNQVLFHLGLNKYIE